MNNIVLEGVIVAIPQQRSVRSIVHFVVFNGRAHSFHVKSWLISLWEPTEIFHDVVTSHVVCKKIKYD